MTDATDLEQTPVEAPSLEDMMTLKARKDALLAEQAEVDRQMAAVKDGSLNVLIEHLRELIVGTGFSFSDVLPKLDPNPTIRMRGKSKGAKKKAASGAQNYPVYVDPNCPENTYKRGVLPAWFKDKMVEMNLDPTKREDRETFKETYLVKDTASPVPAAAPAEPTVGTHNL